MLEMYVHILPQMEQDYFLQGTVWIENKFCGG